MSEQCLAQRFFADEKTQSSLNQLLENLATYKSQLNTVREPNSQLKAGFDQTIKDFSEIRGGNLYYPYLGSGLGNGVFVELADGSIKYDFIIGIGVHVMGHSHPEVTKSCLEASLKDTVMQGHLQQDESAFEFSKTLVKAAQKNGSKLNHCFLTSTGVMADENALKMAFQKNFPRRRVFAFEKCFMGRTLALSQFTDKPALRDGLPLNYQVDYIPFYDYKDPEGSTKRAVATLKQYLTRYPNQHAAMSFELVQGEGGFYTGTTEFFKALMTELKKHDVAIIIDEVQTFSRTSELFAFQHFGLDEFVDFVTVGKASQVCATLFTDHYKAKPGLLSQTFTSSATAIASGKVIIDELINNGHFGADGKNMKINAYFAKKLEELSQKHGGIIEGPYGLGGMFAFTPLGGDKDKVTAFTKKLFENGVIGFMAGANPTRTRFLLPVGVITESDIDAVTEIIEKTLLEVAS